MTHDPVMKHVTYRVYFSTAPAQAWFDECVILDPDAVTLSAQLYDAYAAWTRAKGVPDCSRKAFSKALLARGILQGRNAKHRYYLGLRLRPDPAQSTI